MPGRRIEFQGHDGTPLAGRLDLPDGTPRAYALFAHCFTCTKDSLAASRISRALAARGLGVLRFDFTGLGDSDGEFANTNFSSNVEDLVAAYNHMAANLAAPAILIGHSLGGAAALMAAEAMPQVAGVATIAAPFDPQHLTRHFHGHIEQIRETGEAEVTLAGRPFRIRRQFLEDLSEQSLAPRIAGLKRPLMVFHGPLDAIVGIENASRIFAAARHPKSFVSLDDADHLLTRAADAEYVAAMLAAWSGPLVPGDEDGHAAGEGAGFSAPDEGVRVTSTGEGKFQALVLAGRHRLLADEPESVGGADSGPGPYDYVLAGLGACTSMTLRMYADRKGLALDRVSVHLSHDRIHAEDCEDCETKTGKVDRIRRSISISGDLSEDERTRLLEIADKCPVHRTLESEIRIETVPAESLE